MSNLSLQQFNSDGIELLIDIKTGETFATQSGYARMSGQSKQTISARMVKIEGVKTAEIPTPQGMRTVKLVNEDLIARWIPSDNPAMATQLMKLGVRVFLHKLAGYEVKSAAIEYQIPQTYAEALLEAGRLAMENEKLSAQIEKDAPLVAYAEAVLQYSEESIEFNAFAKMINTGRTRLFRMMRDCGVIMQTSSLPYQKWIDAGYFEVSQEINTCNGKLIPFALVTAKGQIWLHDRLKKHAEDEEKIVKAIVKTVR